MSKLFYRDLQIGILGGGQLGRMLLQAAIDYNLHIHVLDPDSAAPCHLLAHHFTVGSLTDFDSVYRFGKNLDLITIEIENVNTDALAALEQEGKIIYPKVEVIRLIQNKIHQKEWMKKNDIPTSDFITIEHKAEISHFSHKLPFVQKLATGGYDGRGVQIIRTENEFENAFDAPSLLEDLVKIQKELAVIVARNEKGEISVFPSVEMVFHPTANLVEYLLCPAEIPQHIENEAKRIAIEVVEKMKYVGLLAVEMFWDENDKVLVNELAPRPHNSGHHSIRSCQTSQYEQHLRAILNLPLGSTEVLIPAAMLNLLGEDGFSGAVKYEGIEEGLGITGVYPHFYGKTTTKPFRKMGHVTILEADKAKMHEKIKAVQTKLRVISNEK